MKNYSVVDHRDESPCNMCGTDVRLGEGKGSQSLGQSRPDRIWRRYCTNSDCPSVGGLSLADRI